MTSGMTSVIGLRDCRILRLSLERRANIIVLNSHSGAKTLDFVARWSKEFDEIRRALLNCGADLSKIAIATHYPGVMNAKRRATEYDSGYHIE